ncbi:NAD-dependent epimerase/dehydratase family protein [Mariniluteicoccus endophyticus]
MKIWVSGTEGKLGGEVRRQLGAEGHEVVAADVRGTPQVDLEDPAAVRASMRGCDAVVHCAGVPSPEDVAPADLVRTNTMTTFNALEEAYAAGIRTAVLASSGSIYGTAWGPAELRQPYVPVDEDSPLQYVDAYALTKDFVERMGQMFARRGMTVTALRFHWIMAPGERESLGLDEATETKNLWGYVSLADAARACVLGLAPGGERERYEVCVVAADRTWSETPTVELLDRFSPGSERRGDLAGGVGLFDVRRAERVLGWCPSE